MPNILWHIICTNIVSISNKWSSKTLLIIILQTVLTIVSFRFSPTFAFYDTTTAQYNESALANDKEESKNEASELIAMVWWTLGVTTQSRQIKFVPNTNDTTCGHIGWRLGFAPAPPFHLSNGNVNPFGYVMVARLAGRSMRRPFAPRLTGDASKTYSSNNIRGQQHRTDKHRHMGPIRIIFK